MLEQVNAIGKLCLQNAQQGRQLAAAVSVVHTLTMQDPLAVASMEMGDNYNSRIKELGKGHGQAGRQRHRLAEPRERRDL